VVVDAEVNREQGRPLFEVSGEVCKKNCAKNKKGLDRADIVRDVGMITCEASSARKRRLGHISKQGNSLLRFLLVEAAQAATRIQPDWRRRYTHLAMRRHKSIAKVAMGRRLAVRLYWMWRNGCEYSQSLEFGSYAGQLGIGDGVK
jgi:transposase